MRREPEAVAIEPHGPYHLRHQLRRRHSLGPARAASNRRRIGGSSDPAHGLPQEAHHSGQPIVPAVSPPAACDQLSGPRPPHPRDKARLRARGGRNASPHRARRRSSPLRPPGDNEQSAPPMTALRCRRPTPLMCRVRRSTKRPRALITPSTRRARMSESCRTELDNLDRPGIFGGPCLPM